MPESTFRFAMPYLEDINRQATLVANKAVKCRDVISDHELADNRYADPIAPHAVIEDLVNAATSLLLSVRAAAMAAGVGQNRWVV